MLRRAIFFFGLILWTAGANAQVFDTLRGAITGVVRLDSTKIYKVQGVVSIQPDAKLIIPSGTRLEGILSEFNGGVAVSPAVIQTLRGDTSGVGAKSGQLIANGTKERPIVFTSERPIGQKQRGDIGGIVLNGNAPNNIARRWTKLIGGHVLGGGNNPNDTSGILRYVRVEFGGINTESSGNMDGFKFYSVGRGTVLEYLQAHFIDGDAFEWFGGTVNAKWLVASGCRDDAFDFEFGYTGKLQFLAAIQDTAAANRGYESNNDPTGTSRKPHNKYVAYNVTMIGGSRRQANNDINDGIFVRANTGGLHYNHLVANFGASGIVVDGTVTRDNLYAAETSDSGLAIRNSIFWVKNRVDANDTRDNGNPIFAIRRGSGISGLDTTGLFPLYAASANNRVIDPQLRAVNYIQPMNNLKPDLRFSATSPALTAAKRRVL